MREPRWLSESEATYVPDEAVRMYGGFSNSMIEAWWRSLKHNWLFLNPLDSATRVGALVAFYVAEHNSRIPHAAFKGQTPDEMYLGKGDGVAERLASERAVARQRRLEVNRAQRCAACA